GRGRQGRRGDVRAGDSRDRARAARHGTLDRHRQRSRADARVPGPAGALVLAARRHPRGLARDHRPRPGIAVSAEASREGGVSELRALLTDTVTRLFTDLVTKELIESAEKGAWPEKLWRALEEGGLTLPLVAEDQGGAGGAWRDAHVVVRAAGRHAAPVPLAETVVAGWLLAGAGLTVPTGPLTLAPTRRADRLTIRRAGAGWRVSGTATRVPWGRAAGHVVIVVGPEDGVSEG